MAVLTPTVLTTTQLPRPSRGGRPRDPSRDSVIRAAILRLLADVGYGALTMDAVASEAGVGKATIYRRWRTKQDLVVDTISDLNREQVARPDTGSLENDVRAMLQSLLGIVNGPAGAATLSLLSTVAHEPALADAFRRGPLVEWRNTFDAAWARAQERGEVGAGSSGTLISEATSGPIVQRWLLTGEPVDEAYVEEIMQRVALPLIRSAAA
jgi:AcrR family transcriptional regulator